MENNIEKKRSLLGRILRIGLFSLIGLIILLILLIILAPYIAPPIAKSIIKSKINEYVNGTVEIKSFSFSWSGAVHIGDFSITPPSFPNPIVSIKDINTQVDLKALLSSKVIVDVAVDNPIISIVRDKNGTVNIDTLLKQTQSGKQTAALWDSIASPLYAGDQPDRISGLAGINVPLNANQIKQSLLPFIKCKVNIQNGALNITDNVKGNITQFNNIKVLISVNDLNNPISFDISADEPDAKQVRTAKLTGELKIARDSRIDMEATTGKVSYNIQSLSFKNLSAAAGIYSPIDTLSGQVNGEGNYEINGFPSIKGSGRIVMDEIVIESKALTSEPIKLPHTALLSNFTVDAAGNGQQRVTFDAGNLLNAELITSFTGINGPSTTLNSNLNLKSDIKETSESLRNVLHLKTGYGLEGALEAQAKTRIELANNNLRQAEIDGTLVINNLNTVSETGRKTAIEPKINMALKAQVDADKGTVDLSAMQMDSSCIHINGNAAISQIAFTAGGISMNKAVIKSASFIATIGLTELMNKIESFIEIPKLNVHGDIEGNLSLSGNQDNARLIAHLAVKQLQMSNIQSDKGPASIGPYNILFDSTGSLDMRPDAVSQIEYNMALTDASPAHLIKVTGSETLKNIAQGIGSMTCDGKTDVLINFKPIIDSIKQAIPALANLNVEGTAATTFINKFANSELHLQDEPRISITSINGKIGTKEVKAENIEFSARRDLTLNIKDKMALTINELSMTGPGLALTIQGTVNDLSAAPQVKMKLQGKIEPEPFGQKIGALLGNMTISGTPLTMNAEVEAGPELVKVLGQMQAESFDCRGGFFGEQGLSQHNMKGNCDITITLSPQLTNVEIRQISCQSDTAMMSLSGTASIPPAQQGEVRPEGQQNNVMVDAKLTANLDLAKAAQDLGALINLPKDYSIKGKCTSEMTIKTEKGIISVKGQDSITQFEFTPAGAQPISDTNMSCTYEILFNTREFNCSIRQFDVTSGILAGTISGDLLNLENAPEIKGVSLLFTYVPDRLGALMKPWVPVEMKGTDKQELKMTLEGKLETGADMIAAIRHLIMQSSMDLSEVTFAGFTAKGKFGLNLKDERIVSENKLTVNGGTAELKTTVDLRNATPAITPAVRSVMDINTKDVRLNNDMSPLLAMINPIFKNSKGAIDGFANTAFHFDWKGAVDLPALQKDWREAVSPRLTGQGDIAVRELVISGSSLVGEILSKISGDDSGVARGELKESKILVANGRASYKNMTLVLNNLKIVLTGWVQLDEKMELTMRVPITKELAKQYKGIDKMVGQEIDIPVKGTVTSPEVEWKKTLTELAKDIAKSEAEDKIKDKLKPKKRK